MSTASRFVRGTAAAATLGTLIAGAALFALPAAAQDVSGYQAGYDYQDLAMGDGAAVMASDPSTGNAAYYGTTGAALTPAVETRVSTAPATAAIGLPIAEVIGWAALAVAALLIMSSLWSFVAQGQAERRARSRRVAAYQH